MSDNQTLDNLLDETLDDLADLPQVAPFPAGAHQAVMTIQRKEKNGKPVPGAYMVIFEHQAVLEMADATVTPPNPGDKAIFNIFTKKKDGTRNEFGEGQLKLILSPLAERLGTAKIGELIEAAKAGVQVGVVTGVQKSKDPQYQDQMTLKKIELV